MDNGVKQALGSLEAKVDILLDRTSTTEKRVRELELTKYWAKGAAAAVSVAWVFILKLLWK